jgi:hypothetical protein
MQTEPRQEPVQQIDGMLVPVPNAVLGDRLPHRNALEADVPAALHWLEIMVRLGVFRRHEPWIKMFERFVESADRYGVWHPMKGDAMPATTADRVAVGYITVQAANVAAGWIAGTDALAGGTGGSNPAQTTNYYSFNGVADATNPNWVACLQIDNKEGTVITSTAG